MGAYKSGHQRAYRGLAADVDDWTRMCKQRMLTVAQIATQDLTEDVNRPRREGGRMRIDTGFLWHSGLGAINAMPSGPSEKPSDAKPNSYSWDGEAVTTTLLKLKPGDTFYFGWSAVYAPVRELYDGFLEAGLQNWGRYVTFAIDKAKGASR